MDCFFSLSLGNNIKTITDRHAHRSIGEDVFSLQLFPGDSRLDQDERNLNIMHTQGYPHRNANEHILFIITYTLSLVTYVISTNNLVQTLIICCILCNIIITEHSIIMVIKTN